MSNKFKFLCFSVLTFMTTYSFAGGQTSWGKVTETYVNGGWTMVRVESITENPDECEATYYYALNPSQDNYAVLHSALFAAHMAGKLIKFYVNQCGGQSGKYPQIISVFVR